MGSSFFSQRASWSRLRPLTDFLPKPMMPIANRPVLHHLLNLLRRHDVREVGINVHAFSDLIQSYFGDGSKLDMAIEWSLEEELLGTVALPADLEPLPCCDRRELDR